MPKYCAYYKGKWHNFKKRRFALDFGRIFGVPVETVRGKRVIFHPSDKIFDAKNEGGKISISDLHNTLTLLELSRKKPNAP